MTRPGPSGHCDLRSLPASSGVTSFLTFPIGVPVPSLTLTRPSAISLAAVLVAASAAAILPASAVQAAPPGPPAGDPFSVTSTATSVSGTVNLGWRDLKTGASGTYSAHAAGPTLSPDGTKIAAVTEVNASSARITVIDVATGTAVNLTTPAGTATDTSPFWSSDGTTVDFTRVTDNGSSDPTIEIRAVSATASASTTAPDTSVQVADNADYGAAKPGSADITYIEQDPNSTCAVQTLASGSTTPTCFVTVAQLDAASIVDVLVPRWSPDGGTLALSYETDKGAGLLVVTPGSSGGASTLNKLPRSFIPDTTTQFTFFGAVSWAGDGSQLLYSITPVTNDNNLDLAGPGAVRSIDVVTGTHVSTVQTGGNIGADVHIPLAATPPASRFVSVDPVRIADTRSGVGGRTGALNAGQFFDLTVIGNGVSNTSLDVPSNATSVVLNVTAAGPTKNTFISLYPTPTAGNVVPGSSFNPQAGRNSANAVVVSPSSTGKVRIYNAVGTVGVIVDIVGYYVPTGTSGAEPYQPLTPARIVDTRSNLGANGSLGPNGTKEIQVTGTVPTSTGTVAIPASASAVVLNLTGLAGSAQTFAAAYPYDSTRTSAPNVSNLLLSAGEIRAVLVTVKVGENGKVTLRNSAGNTNLLADIEGYYDAGAPDDFVPLAPLRVLDSRSGTYSGLGAAPVPARGTTTFLPQGTLTTTAGEVQVPATATAVVYNLTGVAPSAGTYLAAYPTPSVPASSAPSTSNANLRPGATTANLAITGLGTNGQISLYNAAGSVHVLADLAGYFTP